MMFINGGFSGVISYYTETDWTQKVLGSIAVSSTSNKTYTIGAFAAVDGQYSGWDDVSAKPLTDLTAGALFAGSLPVVKATVNVPVGESAGVWLCGDSKNPNNYIGLVVHRYQDTSTQRGHLYFYKVINGVATRIAGNTIAYATDAPHTVEIRRTAATTFQMWYDNAQVSTDQTVSDAKVQSLKYLGMIATGGGCAVDAFFCNPV